MIYLLILPIIIIFYLLWKCYARGYQPMITGGGRKTIFTKTKLCKLKEYLETMGDTYSAMIIQNNKIIFEYGDTSNTDRMIASMRKSVLAILYGIYDIDISKTLEELGIDDIEGLTDEEKTATIEDLLTARSGVYHPASNSGDDRDKPERGTKKPGTHFVYNNWDFNVLGTIFEKETGVNIFDAVKKLGDELGGFKDYDVEKNKEIYREKAETHSSQSIHPAYHMFMSSRDLAKIGQLMLNNGCYKGKQVVPKKWVKKMTSMITPSEKTRKEKGYGYLWWIYDMKPGNILEGAYAGQGVGGQKLMIIPKLKAVIVLKRNIRKDEPRISFATLQNILGFDAF